MPTVSPDPDATARVDSDDFRVSRRGTPEAQFAPGTMVSGRYRIASILGSGGMGEVYRADDIKLGQQVALKFLPARLARDPILLERLHDEVRLGRQIAHPNVCRIYDIVDWEGAQFVAMEYVDGEDLSRLLHRIGRLAHDKAVDITRGIAAGLAAAHAKGILHRDLKPANIMIDSHGEARIMDFGLALAAEDVVKDGVIAGTPAYMAPEQLQGSPATVQSDLYALGLVMYELFTGKRAHSARTLPERAREITSDITTPSSVVRDLDPAVERIILRCLSNDPGQRPRSARQVIESLPGGDPLAAALAAGETPSPRIVAAAGAEGSLRPAVAWAMLASIAIMFAIAIVSRHEHSLLAYAGLDKPPVVLIERATSLARDAGIPRLPFRSHSFELRQRYIAWIFSTDGSRDRWARLRRGPAALVFRVEERAAPQTPGRRLDDVPSTVVELDTRGRLSGLSAAPTPAWSARPLDWSPLFTAAGLDIAKFTPVRAEADSAVAADARAAWSGRHPEDGTPLRVEAAAWRGIPVLFRVSGAWAPSTAFIPFRNPGAATFVVVLSAAVFAVALLIAWRNLRYRRGDRTAALRLALAMLLIQLVASLLIADHQPAALHEMAVLQRAISDALFWAAMMFVLYLALEPFVRRRWPDHLIASTRLLSGNLRDPMIGRDVLIGIIGGLTHSTLIVAVQTLNPAITTPSGGDHAVLNGLRYGVARILEAFGDGLLQAFGMIVIMVVLAMILRKHVAAAAGLGAIIFTGLTIAFGGFGPLSTTLSVLVATLIAFIAGRFGLLALAVAQATFFCISHYPIFGGVSWYAPTGLLSLVVLAALALWAFRVSLGSQSPFSAALLDE